MFIHCCDSLSLTAWSVRGEVRAAPLMKKVISSLLMYVVQSFASYLHMKGRIFPWLHCKPSLFRDDVILMATEELLALTESSVNVKNVPNLIMLNVIPKPIIAINYTVKSPHAVCLIHFSWLLADICSRAALYKDCCLCPYRPLGRQTGRCLRLETGTSWQWPMDTCCMTKGRAFTLSTPPYTNWTWPHRCSLHFRTLVPTGET